jgi:hypothetical protein
MIIPGLRQPHKNIWFQERKSDHESFVNNSSRIGHRWTTWTPHCLFFRRRPSHLYSYSRWHSLLFLYRASYYPWIVPRIGRRLTKWTTHDLFFRRRPNHLCSYSHWDSSFFLSRASCHSWIVPRIGHHWTMWWRESLFCCYGVNNRQNKHSLCQDKHRCLS